MLNQTFNTYYLEMWAKEWFLKWEIKTLVDKLRDKEEENRLLKEEVKKLKRRIDTMQDFIDYGESIVEEALKLMDVEDNDGARQLLHDNYAVWDDRQYELMEEYDKEN